MKNLIIIIGTIILGALIVNTFVLGEGKNSLYSAADSVTSSGVEAITKQAGIFNDFDIGDRHSGTTKPTEDSN